LAPGAGAQRNASVGRESCRKRLSSYRCSGWLSSFRGELSPPSNQANGSLRVLGFRFGSLPSADIGEEAIAARRMSWDVPFRGVGWREGYNRRFSRRLTTARKSASRSWNDGRQNG
jgi:hypothetical protein